MLNEINGSCRPGQPSSPIAPTLIASLLQMAGVLEGMKDESGYKSFFEKAEDGCSRLS
jgi:hypothetical protein